MTYRPIETAPPDKLISVLTRAKNVRDCVVVDGSPSYENYHHEWFEARADPPEFWWDGPIPGRPAPLALSEHGLAVVRRHREAESFHYAECARIRKEMEEAGA